MKKFLSLIVSLTILLGGLSAFWNISVSAANAILYFSESSIDVGNEFSATLKYDVPTDKYSVKGTVKFDDKILEYVSGASSADGARLNITQNSKGDGSKKELKIVFKAIAPGESYISFDLALTPNGGDAQTIGASASVETKGEAIKPNEPETDGDDSSGLTTDSGFLEVTVDSQKYHIVSDLSNVMIPATLTPETINYKDMDVTVVTDPKNKYEIYYLSSEDGKVSDWFYIDGLGDFHRLNYIISNNMIYITEEEEQNPSYEKSWTLSKLKLETGTVKAYRSTDSRLSGIYIIYCYVNGENGYYRYDTSDNTIQRAPDFVLDGNSSTKTANGNIVTKFSSIPKAGKLIIFLSFFEFLSIICLIISIVNMKKSKKFNIKFEQDDNYDKENQDIYQ